MYVIEPFGGQNVCKIPSPWLFELITTFTYESVLLMSFLKKSSASSSPESFGDSAWYLLNGFGISRNGIVATFGGVGVALIVQHMEN